MIEIIYRVVSFQINVRRVFRNILEGNGKFKGQPQIFIKWTRLFFPFIPFPSDLFCLIFHVEGGWFNRLKYFENRNKYLHCYYSKMSDPYLGMISILLVSADFCLWKGYSKNRLHCEIKYPPHPQPLTSPFSLIPVKS